MLLTFQRQTKKKILMKIFYEKEPHRSLLRMELAGLIRRASGSLFFWDSSESRPENAVDRHESEQKSNEIHQLDENV